jgi:cyclic pyranopterin phosphate synthase
MPRQACNDEPTCGIEDNREAVLELGAIERICRAAVKAGISRFKITGGEPLMREGVLELIHSLKQTEGVGSVTMTTNGVLAERLAEDIYRSGVDCVNVSLDSLRRQTYKAITGSDCLESVLRGIDALYSYGVRLKINCVLQRGLNDGEAADLALIARDRAIDVRFIEMMPIGEGRGITPVLNSEVIKAIGYRLSRAESEDNGPASYYRADGFKGRIGFISAVSSKFCSGCNRLRLTSTGYLKSCLCYDIGESLTASLNDEKRLIELICKVAERKPEGHSFDDVSKITEKKEMNEIGG